MNEWEWGAWLRLRVSCRLVNGEAHMNNGALGMGL